MLRNNTSESMKKWARLRELTELTALIDEMQGNSPVAKELRAERQRLDNELMEYKNPSQEFLVNNHILC